MIYPPATQNPQPGTGGSMKGGPPRAVMHTTESTRMSSAYPWYHIGFQDRGGGEVAIEQFRPFESAAKGLRHPTGTIDTNRQGDACIQGVIIGYAKDSPNLSDYMLGELIIFSLWVQENFGVPRTINALPVGRGDCYGVASRCRMSDEEWSGYTGWCGHQHVPHNTHWDPGLLDWATMMAPLNEAPNLDEVSSWAKASWQWAYEEGLLSTDNPTTPQDESSHPKELITKEQLMVHLKRFQ